MLIHGRSEMTKNRRTVISQGANHANDKPSTTDGLPTPTWTVISVLPENTSILFVDANHILNYNRTSVVRNIGTRLGQS